MRKVVFPLPFVDGASGEMAETRTVTFGVLESASVDVAVVKDDLANAVALLVIALAHVLTRELKFDFNEIGEGVYNEGEPLLGDEFH